MSASRPLLTLLLAALAPALVGAPAATAAPRTYVVNTTVDSVDADPGAPACADARHRCSLRAAVMQADYHAGADTIRLPRGTFRLTRAGRDDDAVAGDLDLTGSTTLRGAGSAATVVVTDGARTRDRVLEVVGDVQRTTLSGLTLRGGRRVATFDQGGTLYWHAAIQGASLVIRDVVVTGGSGYYGGGASFAVPAEGSLDARGLVARGNTARAAGGGVSLLTGRSAIVAIVQSHLDRNRAYEAGGLELVGSAGDLGAARVLVSRSTFDGNHSSVAGGIELYSDAMPTTLADSRVHGNAADILGGGVLTRGSAARIERSTIAGNAVGYDGGGVYAAAGSSTTIVNTTIAGNRSDRLGGGIYAQRQGHPETNVYLTNDTLAGNVATTGGGIFADPGAAFTTLNTLIAHGARGANCSAVIAGTASLSDDASCGFGSGDSVADLRLGPLGRHGGPTSTIVPFADSPAVDAGLAAGAPANDQRGIPRPQGAGIEIGSVETVP